MRPCCGGRVSPAARVLVESLQAVLRHDLARGDETGLKLCKSAHKLAVFTLAFDLLAPLDDRAATSASKPFRARCTGHCVAQHLKQVVVSLI